MRTCLRFQGVGLAFAFLQMNDLNDRKRELERRLGDLTAERDRLLSRLHESQEEMTLMNRKSEAQAATVSWRDAIFKYFFGLKLII